MKYNIDYDYKYEVNEYGQKLIPRDAVEKDGLIILPNGRYMPPDCYHDPKSGLDIIYEPLELDPNDELIENTPDGDEDGSWEEQYTAYSFYCKATSYEKLFAKVYITQQATYT